MPSGRKLHWFILYSVLATVAILYLLPGIGVRVDKSEFMRLSFVLMAIMYPCALVSPIIRRIFHQKPYENPYASVLSKTNCAFVFSTVLLLFIAYEPFMITCCSTKPEDVMMSAIFKLDSILAFVLASSFSNRILTRNNWIKSLFTGRPD